MIFSFTLCCSKNERKKIVMPESTTLLFGIIAVPHQLWICRDISYSKKPKYQEWLNNMAVSITDTILGPYSFLLSFKTDLRSESHLGLCMFILYGLINSRIR